MVKKTETATTAWIVQASMLLFFAMFAKSIFPKQCVNSAGFQSWWCGALFVSARCEEFTEFFSRASSGISLSIVLLSKACGGDYGMLLHGAFLLCGVVIRLLIQSHAGRLRLQIFLYVWRLIFVKC